MGVGCARSSQVAIPVSSVVSIYGTRNPSPRELTRDSDLDFLVIERDVENRVAEPNTPARTARELGPRSQPPAAGSNRAVALNGLPFTVMRSTPLLTEAQPLDGYAVHVRFEDGTTANVDLSYLLDYGGVFEPLRDPAYFARLRADAEAGTIVWPNDADIAPETLYARAQQRAAAA
jgi:hypothetical protein